MQHGRQRCRPVASINCCIPYLWYVSSEELHLLQFQFAPSVLTLCQEVTFELLNNKHSPGAFLIIFTQRLCRSSKATLMNPWLDGRSEPRTWTHTSLYCPQESRGGRSVTTVVETEDLNCEVQLCPFIRLTEWFIYIFKILFAGNPTTIDWYRVRHLSPKN